MVALTRPHNPQDLDQCAQQESIPIARTMTPDLPSDSADFSGWLHLCMNQKLSLIQWAHRYQVPWYQAPCTPGVIWRGLKAEWDTQQASGSSQCTGERVA